MSEGLTVGVILIRPGAWLRWAYLNLPERDYLRVLKAVHADQAAAAKENGSAWLT